MNWKKQISLEFPLWDKLKTGAFNNPVNKIHITFTFQEMAKEGHGATKFIGGYLY